MSDMGAQQFVDQFVDEINSALMTIVSRAQWNPYGLGEAAQRRDRAGSDPAELAGPRRARSRRRKQSA